jgi:hypothetical protein
MRLLLKLMACATGSTHAAVPWRLTGHVPACSRLQRADQAVADLFTSIANNLAGLVEVVTGQQKPQVSISPFTLFNNGAANVSTNLAGAQAAVRAPKSTTNRWPKSPEWLTRLAQGPLPAACCSRS